jgi:competence protein ComEC
MRRPNDPARKRALGTLRDMLGLSVLLAITLPFVFRQHAEQSQKQAPMLRVTFLDVGKGDAAVIETPSGNVAVVDTGGLMSDGADHGETTIGPFLREHGRARIGVLVLTHPHPDHISGAATLMNDFPVNFLFDNGLGGEVPEVQRYRQVARRKQIRYHAAARGTSISLGDGVMLRLLAPPQTSATGRINNSSIVIRLDYGKTSFLLTGDAEAESEAEMLASGQNVACTVLKVGHHGSRASTSPELLAAAHPQIAVLSVNANNRAGYPHPEVLERLRAVGARLYRTDRNGHVTCLSDGDHVRVETQR